MGQIARGGGTATSITSLINPNMTYDFRVAVVTGPTSWLNGP
jgi:hypothetical protein